MSPYPTPNSGRVTKSGPEFAVWARNARSVQPRSRRRRCHWRSQRTARTGRRGEASSRSESFPPGRPKKTVAAPAIGEAKEPLERVVGRKRALEANRFLQVGPEKRAAHLDFRVEQPLIDADVEGHGAFRLETRVSEIRRAERQVAAEPLERARCPIAVAAVCPQLGLAVLEEIRSGDVASVGIR